jgi:hypothetical protein
MNTRWHEEDVAGRVLGQIERNEIRGRVISIPAIAEENDPLGRHPGEFLWDDPSGYNYAAFLRARQRETTPMMWLPFISSDLRLKTETTSKPPG